MKQLHPDKYNVAWYKLAEFVVRKEKERALALLRLLTHSFNDQALKDQLEGDLLRSFDDCKNASEKYFAAAQLYSKEGKSIDSAALYELLITLNPEDFIYVKHALLHYRSMGDTKRIKVLLHRAISMTLNQGAFDYLHDLLFTFGHELSKADYHHLLIQAVVELIAKKASEDLVHQFIKDTLVSMTERQDKKAISTLLARLKHDHESWYDYAELIICDL